MPHCKYQFEAIVAAAKHFTEPDSGTGPRKRRRLSFSAADDDEEGQDDTGPVDFEVSCDISSYQFIDFNFL